MNLLNTIITKAMLGLRSLKDERGQDLMEYALLGGFIAVAFVTAALLTPLGSAMQEMTDAIAECVDFDSVCP